MLFHLIYVSTSVLPMTEDQLETLLRQCRARNGGKRVTGMLLYKNGQFVQVLEGAEPDVMEIFRDIEDDLRHKGVDVLRAEYIQHRDFPDWTMGFANLDKLDPSQMPGYTRFLDADFDAAYFSEETVEAHAILLAFKGHGES